MGHDFKYDFQTPPEFCKFMADMVPGYYRKILEPTPGMGNLVRALQAKGFKDVTAPEDFFLLDFSKRYECIVMNPPFSHKFTILDNAPDQLKQSGMKMGYLILQQCLQMSNHVIALMPWFTISDSDVRLRAIKEYGLKRIIALPRRTFDYARVQTVILELVKGYQEPTQFDVYDLLISSQQKINYGQDSTIAL